MHRRQQSNTSGGGRGRGVKEKLRPEGYAGFIFNPADLAEDVDLDDEMRKELLFIEAHLESWHHYDLLGVRPRTPIEEIRRRFLELSRRFHPDRYYGKRLGSYASRLNKVFQALNRAQEVLCDSARKAEYDRVTDIPLTPEERAEKEREDERKSRDAEDARRRRERLTRRNPFLRSRAKMAELMKEAEAAEAQEDWRKAAGLLRLAAGYAPNDKVLAARVEEIDRKAKSQRAADLAQQAQSALLIGSSDQAARLFEEAATAAPGDLEIVLARARFLLSRGGATEELLAATRQAVAAGRGSSPAWTLHGNALLRAGKKKEAREAFQRALKIDPRNKEAEGALKKLKWVIF